MRDNDARARGSGSVVAGKGSEACGVRRKKNYKMGRKAVVNRWCVCARVCVFSVRAWWQRASAEYNAKPVL